MSKRLYILTLTALLLGAPLAAEAEPEREVETELTGVTLTVNGSTIHVTNAQGQDLHVYNIAGVKIATVHIDTNDKTITLNLQKGCYIVKVAKQARKISVK